MYMYTGYVHEMLHFQKRHTMYTYLYEHYLLIISFNGYFVDQEKEAKYDIDLPWDSLLAAFPTENKNMLHNNT